MGFIETSYAFAPNLSQVNIDSNLNLGTYGITTDGELNINDSDLIGVKRFMCEDYLGAIKTTASSTTQETLILDNVYDIIGHTKKFRIPSNIEQGSTINFTITARNTDTTAHPLLLDKYDPNTDTYTNIGSLSVPAGIHDWQTITATINAGDIVAFGNDSNKLRIQGVNGAKIQYNFEVVSKAVWEVID